MGGVGRRLLSWGALYFCRGWDGGLLGASEFLAGLGLGVWGCEGLSEAISSKWVLKLHVLRG